MNRGHIAVEAARGGTTFRLWAILLAVTVGTAGFGLAMSDRSASRWVGAGMLLVLVVVGVGQPIRLLSLALAPVFSGLYLAIVTGLSSDGTSSSVVTAVLIATLAVASASEMVGRLCTSEDERRISAAMAAECLSPIDPLSGVMKWQHAEPVFEREISRARRLGHDLGFLLVCIDGAEQLDRRLGPDAARSAISTIGGHLLRCCRSTDVVLYRGVGQFGVVLPDTSPELVDVVIRRLVGSAPRDFPGTLLVGAASFPRDGESPAELMRHAAETLDQPARQHGPAEEGLRDPPADATAASL